MLKKLWQSEYIRNITILTSGTTVAQLIPILISPVLSRLYTPEEFGLFAFYMSVVGLCALIATLRFELTIIIPKNIKQAKNLFLLSLLTTFVYSLVAFGIIILLEIVFFPRISMEHILKTWFLILPIIVLLIGTGNVFQNWLNRNNQYKNLGIGKIINSLGNNSILLIIGFIGGGAWGLLLGNVFGLVLFNLFFIYQIFVIDKVRLGRPKKQEIISLTKEYKEFPLVNTPQALIESLQLHGLIYLLKIFFNTTIVGWYSFAMRVLQAPMWLVGTSVAQVFYKDASGLLHDTGNIFPSVKRTLKFTAVVGLPVIIILLFFGPQLFSFIFGQSWRDAGIYAQILAPWIYFDFIRYSVSQAPILVKRMKSMFMFSVTGNIIMISSVIGVGLYNEDIFLTFAVLSALMSVYDMLVIGWIIKIAKNSRHIQTSD